MSRLSASELGSYIGTGFVIARGFCPASTVTELRETALLELAAGRAPVELEAALGYPGAPNSKTAPGGNTIRRLLNAVDRQPVFRDWLVGAEVAAAVRDILGEEALMSRAHHNCIMTKHPRHGSRTNWHRDIRYWSFGFPGLVSMWLALGSETRANGALSFIPSSHALDLPDTLFDEQKFLRLDVPAGRELAKAAVPVALEPGDTVFFHCRTLHAAGPNLTDAVKFSLVATYRGVSNPPLPRSRSAAMPEISLQVPGDE